MPKEKPLSREELESAYRVQCANLGIDVEVFSSGPLNATVAIIGEGPGETEVRDKLRRPFIGGAGQLLFAALARYGLNRQNVYTTNVSKRQISLSRHGNEKHAVHRDELDKWVGMLQWELSQLPNLKYVLLMGNFAMEAMIGMTGVLNLQGSVYDVDLPNGVKGKAICTFNPAYVTIHHEPRLEPFFNLSCQKLDMVIKGTFKPYVIDHIINPTFREAIAWIRDMKRSKKPVGFDVETMDTMETVCYGLGNDPHRAMCINLRDHEKNRFSVGQEADLLLALKDLFDSNVRLVIQNAMFDCYHEWYRNHLRFRAWADTLLAHHTLYPRLPHSLAFLCSQYTTHPFYKDEGKEWKEGGSVDDYWRYNVKDVCIMLKAWERMHGELIAQKQDKFFFEHVMRAQPHLVSATVHGIRRDQSIKELVLDQVQEDVDTVKKKFHDLVHEITEDTQYSPNPNSPKQLRELFFERLKMHGRGFSTDEANRAVMMKDSRTSPLEKEMLATLNKFKEEDKFRGTYAQARDSDDGRFRTEYRQYGVIKAPGRLSSRQLIYGEGGNMQNQPVRVRVQFVADEGCVFIYFDLGQAEARVVGWRADIPKWKEQFERARIDGKYDAHRALAADMFKIPYDDVPKDDWDADGKPTVRYKAKRCRHGLNYRMERYKLSEVTELPYNEAVRCFIAYHNVTPEVMKWWKEEERQFKMKGEVYNGLGRRFKVVERLTDDVLDSIVANYPQSTIGDKIVQVWYQAEEDDRWPDPMYARIGINVHDNLVGITTPKYAKTCLKILKEYAESPILIQDVYRRRPAEPLIIPAECKISVPTLWNPRAKKDWKGKPLKSPGAFLQDPNGLHRWSHMESIEL